MSLPMKDSHMYEEPFLNHLCCFSFKNKPESNSPKQVESTPQTDEDNGPAESNLNAAQHGVKIFNRVSYRHCNN